MKRLATLSLAALVASSVAFTVPASAPNAGEKPTPGAILVRNATIWTQGPEGTLPEADLLIIDGKIERVGRNLDAPDGAHVIDATGKHVTPGLVDCPRPDCIVRGALPQLRRGYR